MMSNNAMGERWADVQRELFTEEEIATSSLRVALIGELVKARRELGLTQERLAGLSGVKQPVISRLEQGETDPQIDTILKVLAPLGKTLAIVPLRDTRETSR